MSTIVGFCLLGAGILATWDYWIFLWDGYGHHGVFRCAIHQKGNTRTRECIADADELVFEEVVLADGAIESSWFSGGVFEYRRTYGDQNGVRLVIDRALSNCWRRREDEGLPRPVGIDRQCKGP
jgi:hypothetical protein